MSDASDHLLARPTPVHARLALNSRTNAWRTWNGYTVAGVLDQGDVEYLAFKDAAVLADLSPLREYEILGDEAAHYLDRLTTRPVGAMPPGSGRAMFLCRDDGRVVSQAVVLRRSERDYVLTCETDISPWLDAGRADFNVDVRDVSTLRAVLALSGPKALHVLNDAGFTSADRLAWGQSEQVDHRGLKLEIARIGARKGGYELRIKAEDAEILWDRLDRAGRGFLRPVGLDTLERHRILYGRPRQGVDFPGACEAANPQDAPTPFDLGQGAWIDFDKGRFTGRAALRQVGARPVTRPVVRLTLANRTVCEGARVLRETVPVGWLTSCATCPLSGQTRAFATISGGVEDWERLAIESRQGAVTAQVWPAQRRAALTV